MSTLLISDANILIDLQDGGLITELFKLPYQFRVPDLLYYDELEDNHRDLLRYGLQIGELTPESMAKAEQLAQKYKQPSRYDCFALVLAMQEACPLLTGDQNLRKAAEQEQIEVKGTLWLIEALVTQQIITIQIAREAYKAMKQTGRRLPWAEAENRLSALESSL